MAKYDFHANFKFLMEALVMYCITTKMRYGFNVIFYTF